MVLLSGVLVDGFRNVVLTVPSSLPANKIIKKQSLNLRKLLRMSKGRNKSTRLYHEMKMLLSLEREPLKIWTPSIGYTLE